MYISPLPAIIHHPWFVADISGWNNDGVPVGQTFGEDRAYLGRLRDLPNGLDVTERLGRGTIFSISLSFSRDT
jgi:hypothetical protein